MRKLLIATSNASKREEISYGLQDLIKKGLQVLTLKDVTTHGDPIESGLTFEDNAKIKAQFYGDQTGLPTISDDGGLLIDALDGQPGVKSRRWPGYEASDEELIHYALDKMKTIKMENRTAKLETCVCFYIPSTKMFCCQQEAVEGIISETPCTWDTNGYPYRALFIVKEYAKFYDQLTEKEHQKTNHRLKALQKLKTCINEQIMV